MAMQTDRPSAGWVFATGQPLCLRDITDETEVGKYKHLKWSDKYGGYATSKDKAHKKRFLAVPIFSCRAKKKVIAVLRIAATKAKNKVFTEQHLQLLQTYSAYLSGLLTTHLKSEEERDLIERLFTVARLSDIDALLDETAQSIPVVMDGSHWSIFLRKPAYAPKMDTCPARQAAVK